MFVVEHACGETWIVHTQGTQSKQVRVTFYDANHCPGAAIIAIELPDGKVHLHTGDMRYHEKMKSYPLLKQAALGRNLDLLLLDTTYGAPKHDFLPQETAVDIIASQVQELLGEERSETLSTLVLLSCYSIGKEKVLWEASSRSNQLVYVNERKLRMLQCIQGHEEISSQVIQRCTRDPDLSDVHVVPMGIAGEMFPFFLPNFIACADYTNELTKKYDKVVAFIPTGWAEASNWNKKNAVSQQHCQGVDVEVRLISYSEHSAFSELKEFVDFLKPRKIIPTVFKDENDSRRIEARFKIDLGRAKEHFFKKMAAQSSPPPTATESTNNTTPDSDGEVCGSSRKRKETVPVSEGVSSLLAMGFNQRQAEKAMQRSNGNIERAIVELLGQQQATATSASSGNEGIKDSQHTATSKSSPNQSSQRITNFFSVKKSKR
jgi:hypothetical protein